MFSVDITKIISTKYYSGWILSNKLTKDDHKMFHIIYNHAF